MSRLFVAGTDTGVGKTIVTGLLARVTGWAMVKPVASGLADPGPSDLEMLAMLGGQVPRCFQTWGPPLAPHRAAEVTGEPLDALAFMAWLKTLPTPALVEGVGGWRVPLLPGFEMPDLARQVCDRVVVVAANRLGVLNHTRLTVEAVQRDGLTVVGVVLNGAGGDPSSIHNLGDLRAVVDVPVIPLGSLDLMDTAEVDAAATHLASAIPFG